MKDSKKKANQKEDELISTEKDSQNEKFDKQSFDGDSIDKIIPDDILEAIPVEDRSRVSSIIRQTMISGVRQGNPIAEKITPEHISLIISKSDEQDKRDREERKGERNYSLLLIIIALAFIVFLFIFLKSNEELLIKVVIAIVSFLGGFGFGKTKKSKEDQTG